MVPALVGGRSAGPEVRRVPLLRLVSSPRKGSTSSHSVRRAHSSASPSSSAMASQWAGWH
eukprot:12598611-Heterocapsa_arctica.AAC.1